jgi:hypothetical protein
MSVKKNFFLVASLDASALQKYICEVSAQRKLRAPMAPMSCGTGDYWGDVTIASFRNILMSR